MSVADAPSMSVSIKAVREALMRARILLPHADPTSRRGAISEALVDALDALTDVVEDLHKCYSGHLNDMHSPGGRHE